MVSQIGVVVAETASDDRRTVVEKDVIQAGDTGDCERSGVKKDFASRNGGLVSQVTYMQL